MAAKQMSDMAVSVFCENMAMMLAAGIGPDEAAGLLCSDAASDGELAAAAKAVQDAALAGAPFADAVAQSGAFPSYMAKMLAAGERAGRTEQVLRTLAVYYENCDRLQKKLRSAVLYPMVLLFLMAVILIFLVARLLPVFFGVYESVAGELTASSYGYIQIATVVGWTALGFTVVLAVLFLAGYLLGRTGSGRKTLARFGESFPMTAQASRQRALAAFTQVLAIFVASGMDVDASVEAASEMADHRELGRKLAQIRREMAQGKGLATAFYENQLYEPLYGRMLLSGARSGQLEPVLARLSALLTEDADRLADSLLDSIEPALSAFLTVAVGVTLLAVMLPLVGILGAIG